MNPELIVQRSGFDARLAATTAPTYANTDDLLLERVGRKYQEHRLKHSDWDLFRRQWYGYDEAVNLKA